MSVVIGLVNTEYSNIFISEMGKSWSVRPYHTKIGVYSKNANKIIIPDFKQNEFNIALKKCDIVIYIMDKSEYDSESDSGSGEWICVSNKKTKKKTNKNKKTNDQQIFGLSIKNGKLIYDNAFKQLLEKITSLVEQNNSEETEEEYEESDEEEIEDDY